MLERPRTISVSSCRGYGFDGSIGSNGLRLSDVPLAAARANSGGGSGLVSDVRSSCGR